MAIGQGSHVRWQFAPQFKQAGSTPGAGVGSDLSTAAFRSHEGVAASKS